MAKNDKLNAKRATAPAISYKEFSFAIKEPTVEGRTVCGYLAVFGNKDSDCDILIKGCFAKSLTERGVGSPAGNKIAHLWQHQMCEPLGKYITLKEDDFGLYFEAVYDDIELANRALTQIKSGTLNKFSIGYTYVWDKMEYDEVRDAFICKELNLYEGSVVTLAANDMTYVTGVKSEQKAEMVESLKEDMDMALVGVKSHKQFEIRQIFSKLMALATVEPVDSQKEKIKGESKPLEQKPAAKSRKTNLSKLTEL